MIFKLTTLLYRITATIIVSLPMLLNVYFQGSIVASLLYIPLLTMLLIGLAVYIDYKLVESCQRARKITKAKLRKLRRKKALRDANWLDWVRG